MNSERKPRRKESRRRNRKGTGACFERTDGRWEGRLSLEGGGATYVYGRTEREVQRKLFAEQRAPRVRDPEGLSVGEWLDRWLEMVQQRRRFKTYNDYKGAVQNHIKPHLESIKLNRLTQAHIYKMFDALIEGKTGAPTLDKVYRTLHTALQVAFKRQKVAANVVALETNHSARRPRRSFFKRLRRLNAFETRRRTARFAALYLTALDTGARSGELRALQWKNVDLNKGKIRIEATLAENEDGEMVVAPPKTASSVRIVKLTKNNIELLRTHQKDQMASEHGLSTWVFPNIKGGPLRKDALLSSDWNKVIVAAKVRGLTFHGLRHTHATILAASGVPVRSVMDRLGHSTSRMTLEVYSHATTAMQDDAVHALDALHEKIDSQIDSQNAQTLMGE